MSLRSKLVTTLAALCMVICLLAVGVWAASSATVTLKGIVNFQATDVQVTVVGAYSGTKNNGVGTVTGAIVNDFDETAEAGEEEEIARWNALNEETTLSATWGNTGNGLDLTFADKKATIVVVIKVRNDNTQRKVNFDFQPTLGGESKFIAAPATGEGVDPLTLVPDTNVKASYAVSGVAAGDVTMNEGSTTAGSIKEGGTALFTITMQIYDRNNEVKDVKLGGTMTLTDPGHVAEGSEG